MTGLILLAVTAMVCLALVVIFATCYSYELVRAWREWREERRRHPED